MRLLVVSNFYPPHHIGGYELRCQEVVDLLRGRGYTVQVLTSVYGVKRVDVTGEVWRVLRLETNLKNYRLRDLLSFPARTKANLRYVSDAVTHLRPDTGFVWGMWGLSRLIPAHLEKLVPVLYSIGDIWPAMPDSHIAYWQAPAQHRELRSLKAILYKLMLKWLKIWGLPATLKFEYAFCNSFSLRQRLTEAGVPLQHAKVIHSGVHLEPFIKASQRQLSDNAAGGLRLLCAGRLYENKGMHVAIEALAEVRRRDGNSNVILDIVGSGEADYEAYLHKLIEEYNLRDHVSIYPAVPHSQIPDLLAQYNVLVFPSFQEGFSRLLIEAMAAGLVIVGTSSCGSGEVWIDGKSGLTFEAGDAHHLAHQIERLALDSALRKRLALAGVRTVQERFDIERMVDQIEAYLLEVTHGHHEKIP